MSCIACIAQRGMAEHHCEGRDTCQRRPERMPITLPPDQDQRGSKENGRTISIPVWFVLERPAMDFETCYNHVPCRSWPRSERDHMPKFNRILTQLQSERNRAQEEMQRLDKAIRVMQQLDGGRSGMRGAGRKPRRRISAAARARMAAGQRARWARAKAAKAPKSRTTSQRHVERSRPHSGLGGLGTRRSRRKRHSPIED